MIAPTNCNPDCDCAQRMVRCQRAAPINEVARESLVRSNVFLDRPPPYVIPASLGSGLVGTAPRGPARMPEIDPPESVFKAATETYKHEPDHFIDALRELEKEFPATMGIAPFPEDAPGVTLREFTPEENAAFDAANAKIIARRVDVSHIIEKVRRETLHNRLVHAFRTCELDCGMWSDNALNELADIAIATLEAT